MYMDIGGEGRHDKNYIANFTCLFETTVREISWVGGVLAVWSERALSSSSSTAVMATLKNWAPIGRSVNWGYGLSQISEEEQKSYQYM